jgi:arylsulfatase A-like enzyme
LVAGCAPAERPDDAPSVLLVTIDTARADHFSSYGYERPTTPFIDGLAREGILFEAAYTPTPTTAPAHASLFTASYPSEHGVLKNGHVLAAGRPTLAAVLQNAGYRTAAIVSSYVLARHFGLGQGFAYYDDDFTTAKSSVVVEEWEDSTDIGHFDRRADETTDRAIAWLRANARAAPFFLWVHYFDPHHPYDPPAAQRLVLEAALPEPGAPATPGDAAEARERTLAYDAEIRFVDDQVARLVGYLDDTLGRARTLVIVATDHGEGLMQRGWMAHGVHLHEELVRAALIMRWPPHLPSGRRVAAPVGLIDIAPTVLALLELEPMSGPAGTALQGQRADGDVPPDRPLFFQRRPYATPEYRGWNVRDPMFGLRRGRWKYIETDGVGELFDLSADSGETRNVRAEHAAAADALAAELRAWRERIDGHTHSPQQISPEDAARLRALGYVE